MNNKYPSHLLPKGVFSSITNAYVDNNRLFKRGGSTVFGATLGSFLLLGAYSFETTTGLKEVVVNRNGASNAQLYKSTGGSFTAIGLANLTKDIYMNFVQASDKLFGFNGAEVVDVAVDGTTVTRNRAGVPKGLFGVWFHNYLFVGGVSATPNRIYWSNLGDPLTFDAGNFVDINANDGDVLTALNVLNDQLVIFKNYSIWSIDGWSGSTFNVTTIAGQNTQMRAQGAGTPSHQSVVSVGRDLLYMSFLGNLPHIRSLNQTSFAKSIDAGIQSDELEGTMATLNKTKLVRSCGMFDGKFLHWGVPVGAATTNDLIIVSANQRKYQTPLGPMEPWVQFEGANVGQFFTSTISGIPKIYYISATANGKVYLFNDTSTYSDDGTPVSMEVNSRDYMGDPGRQTKYKYMYLKYQTGSAGTLQVNARIDQASDFASQEDISLRGSSPGLGPTGTFTLGVSVLGGSMVNKNRITFQHLTGTLLGVQFIEATANACELYDLEILGQKKGYRAD